MQIPSSLSKASSSKPSANRYSVSERVSKMTREELRSGVEDRIGTVKLESYFATRRAEGVLARIDKYEGQTIGEILSNSTNYNKVQAAKRKRISNNLLLSGSGVASLGLLTLFNGIESGSIIPGLILLGGGLGLSFSAVLQPDFRLANSDQYMDEREVEDVRNLAEFVAYPERQVELPQMTGPIAKDDFIAEVMKQREAPHPLKELVQRSADNLLSILPQTDATNTGDLVQELALKEAQAKTGVKLSFLKHLVGCAALAGGAAWMGGRLSLPASGLPALGLALSGLALMASADRDIPKFQKLENELRFAQRNVRSWENSLTGNETPEFPRLNLPSPDSAL